MDLSLTDDQKMMREEARRLLAERASSERIRAAIAEGGHDTGLWATMSRELGWCGVGIAEDFGGLGMGARDVALLAMEIGARLAPVPFWSQACLATPLIAALGSDAARATLLPRIAAGELTVAVAVPQPSHVAPFSLIDVEAKHDGGSFVLDGNLKAVFDLASSDLVIVPAILDGAPALFAVERGSIARIVSLQTIDPTRPVSPAVLEGTSASMRIDRGDLSLADFDAPLRLAKLGLAAEQVGAAQGCLDLTLDYVGTRVQFGRTIASFQAIKHRCAELFVRLAEARSLLFGAAEALATNAPDATIEIEGAGVLAGEVLWRAAEEAVQLHGGVGNTWEYDPHLYLRRAQATAHLFGSAEDRLAAVHSALSGLAA